MKKYICEREELLSSFLRDKLAEASGKQVKSLLKYGKIKMNGKVTVKGNLPLHKGDTIEISDTKYKNPGSLIILYEDASLLAVYKKEGLLTVATAKEANRTLYREVSTYVKQNHKNAKIFIVHRLDRDTSGVVLFAKNQKIKTYLQEHWDEVVVQRGYSAVVEGELSANEGTLVHDLFETESGFVKVVARGKGKCAITKYKVTKTNGRFSLLEIALETGRKNQIRAQFSYIGHPVVGDKKYGSSSTVLRRLALHADKLVFVHPVTKKRITCKVDVPSSFSKIVKK